MLPSRSTLEHGGEAERRLVEIAEEGGGDGGGDDGAQRRRLLWIDDASGSVAASSALGEVDVAVYDAVLWQCAADKVCERWFGNGHNN